VTESVVVHYRDGQLVKGHITEFSGENPTFQVRQLHGGPEPISVDVENLKAVFFVKDFVGNAKYDEVKAISGRVNRSVWCPNGSRVVRRRDPRGHG
jgi:hypothetical protein